MENKFSNIWFRMKQSQWYGSIKPYIIMGANLWLLISLPLYGYQWLGVWGFFLGIILFVAIKVVFMRKMFMYFVRDVETKFFGKPLDKDKWEEGEFKKPKLVWKKSKEEKDDNNN